MSGIARYDDIADFYAQFAPDSYTDPPMVALLEIVGAVSGLRLLDLACGHGRMSRELARRGAHVVGVDLSVALVELARVREAQDPLHITYVHADVATPAALQGELFDGVVCSFGLSDIDDLNGALATVARVLRPGGYFACSLLHPCFPGWPSTQASPSWNPKQGYYTEGWWRASSPAHGLRPKVGASHRMLSTYINSMSQHELLVEALAEPQPDANWLTAAPSSGAVPVYLVMRCRRQGG